jgi:hypothetical protein
VAADKIVQDPERQYSYGQQCIDYGNAYVAHHAKRAQEISAAVDTLGDVHGEYKDTWHQVTKPAYLAAHTAHGKAWIAQGHASKATGHAFHNAEQENVTRIGSVSAEGSAGVATPNGIPT